MEVPPELPNEEAIFTPIKDGDGDNSSLGDNLETIAEEQKQFDDLNPTNFLFDNIDFARVRKNRTRYYIKISFLFQDAHNRVKLYVFS